MAFIVAQEWLRGDVTMLYGYIWEEVHVEAWVYYTYVVKTVSLSQSFFPFP